MSRAERRRVREGKRGFLLLLFPLGDQLPGLVLDWKGRTCFLFCLPVQVCVRVDTDLISAGTKQGRQWLPWA